MYHIATIQKNEIKNKVNLFMIEGVFSIEELGQASKIEVEGSSITDQGNDFCLFTLFKEDGTTITRRAEGY